MISADIPIQTNQGPRITMRDGISLREDVLYTDANGRESKAIRKRTDKALTALQEILRRALEPSETVLFVTRCGKAPVGWSEQFFFSQIFSMYMQTVLVFTNRRLLHFAVRSNGTWKRILRSVRWEDVAESKVSGWLLPQLQLKFRDENKEGYWRFPRAEGKKVKMLLGTVAPPQAGAGFSAQGMVPLCPQCLSSLRKGIYRCASCRMEFKDEKTMVRRSLLIPGGGYFYAGMKWLGTVDFVVESWLSVLILIFVLEALSVIPPSFVESGQDSISPAAAWISAAFVGAILAVEKYVTVHHCKPFIRQFIPAK